MSIETSSLKFSIGGVEYTWFGGFGAVFQSRERGVEYGTVRKIGKRLYYAYLIDKGEHRFQRPKISWSATDMIEVEDLRAIKNEIFGS